MAGAPQRKALPHDIPSWIDPSREVYFITICCRHRRSDLLTRPEISAGLLETVAIRNARGVWHAHLFLIMPDHVHALLGFPVDSRLRVCLAKWKEWTAKSLGIVWQRDFFEHRLRDEQARREKADYILANPVRRGLVATAAEWPHIFQG